MDHHIVYRRDDHYASFPHIAVGADGDLLAVFREAGAGTAKAALTGEHTHQDADSRILFSRSVDGGRTWAAPVVASGGDRAVNDPAITVLADERYLVRFCQWILAPGSRRHELPGPVMRHFVRMGQVGTMAGNAFALSEDGGETWHPVEAAIEGDLALQRAMSREPVVVMADGSFVLSVYEGYPFHTEQAWLMRSWNGGLRWGDASPIGRHYDPPVPYRQGASVNEVSVLPLDDLTLLAIARVDRAFTADEGNKFISEGGVGELMWTISRDAGLTWDALRPTGIYGQPAHGLQLADGRLLCTYGYRRPPYGVRAALFCIDGQQWHTERTIVLRDDAAGWDCGYPASAQLPDGTIVSIYYLHHEDGVRYVACTRWQVDEMNEGESLQ